MTITKDPNPNKRITVMLTQDVVKIIQEKAAQIDPSFPNISQALRAIVLEWEAEKVVSIPIRGKLDSGWQPEQMDKEQENDTPKRDKAA
jgi:hypothetical protein